MIEIITNRSVKTITSHPMHVIDVDGIKYVTLRHLRETVHEYESCLHELTWQVTQVVDLIKDMNPASHEFIMCALDNAMQLMEANDGDQ